MHILIIPTVVCLQNEHPLKTVSGVDYTNYMQYSAKKLTKMIKFKRP